MTLLAYFVTLGQNPRIILMDFDTLAIFSWLTRVGGGVGGGSPPL